MKILLTGTTTLMANGRRRENATFITFFPVLYEMLKGIKGVQVDWRPTYPGEDLKGQYDLALLGMQAVNGLAGKEYKYGVLWACTQLPHAIVFDDWQVTPTMRALKKSNYLFRTFGLGKRGMAEHAIAMQPKMTKVIDHARQSLHDEIRAVIAPLFKWGDHEKFKRIHPMHQLFAVDPSTYVPNLVTDDVNNVRKQRAWVLASLIDQTDWANRLGNAWPFVRQHAVKGVRGWGMIPEAQLINDVYAHNWGVLSPKYNSAIVGTGWWRARYNYAAQAGAILHADRLEVAGLNSTAYNLTVPEIEVLTTRQLKDVATSQREMLETKTAARSEAIASLREALNWVSKYGQPV